MTYIFQIFDFILLLIKHILILGLALIILQVLLEGEEDRHTIRLLLVC